jgi:hypothetical protein
VARCNGGEMKWWRVVRWRDEMVTSCKVASCKVTSCKVASCKVASCKVASCTGIFQQHPVHIECLNCINIIKDYLNVFRNFVINITQKERSW